MQCYACSMRALLAKGTWPAHPAPPDRLTVFTACTMCVQELVDNKASSCFAT